MTRQLFGRIISIFSLYATLLILGCATEKHQKLLSFFFDGVPGTEGEFITDDHGEDEDRPRRQTGRENVRPLEAEPPDRIIASVHPPFENGGCADCHASQFSQKMKEPTPGLCFQCHNEFSGAKVIHGADCSSCHRPHESENEKLLVRPVNREMCLECHDDPVGNTKRHEEPEITDFLGPLPKLVPSFGNKVKHPPAEESCLECHSQHASENQALLLKPMPAQCFECHEDFFKSAKVKHEPALNGECMSCHAPHASDLKALLIRPVRQLCLECHDDPLEKGKVKHPPVEDGCIECHSPHASNNKGLLKKSLTATCFECHDDFLKDAKFKHDPAANGECMGCHAPHASDMNALLIKDSPALCFECHEEDDIKKVKAHQRFPDRACTSCHDPHGGKEEKFLKPGILKLTTAPESGTPKTK